jgi:ketosteroid isomerase-like protein
MKHLLVLLALTVMTFSCNSSNESTAADPAGVEEAVENFRQVMVDPDEEKLRQLTSDQLTYGHSNGVIEDQNTCIESMVSGKFNFLNVNLSEQTIDMSGNTAIVRHILNGDTHDAGKDPGKAHIKVMQVWQNQAGQWKLLARQAVKVQQ